MASSGVESESDEGIFEKLDKVFGDMSLTEVQRLFRGYTNHRLERAMVSAASTPPSICHGRWCDTQLKFKLTVLDDRNDGDLIIKCLEHTRGEVKSEDKVSVWDTGWVKRRPTKEKASIDLSDLFRKRDDLNEGGAHLLMTTLDILMNVRDGKYQFLETNRHMVGYGADADGDKLWDVLVIFNATVRDLLTTVVTAKRVTEGEIPVVRRHGSAADDDNGDTTAWKTCTDPDSL
jgi:hypothetical protein